MLGQRAGVSYILDLIGVFSISQEKSFPFTSPRKKNGARVPYSLTGFRTLRRI